MLYFTTFLSINAYLSKNFATTGCGANVLEILFYVIVAQ